MNELDIEAYLLNKGFVKSKDNGFFINDKYGDYVCLSLRDGAARAYKLVGSIKMDIFIGMCVDNENDLDFILRKNRYFMQTAAFEKLLN